MSEATKPKPINPAELIAVASTFCDLRAGIMDVLTDNLRISDTYDIEGREATAEALIFFFAQALNPRGLT